MARKDAEFTHKVREQINQWDKRWSVNRKMYHEMTGFIMGEQWREDESKVFTRYNKMPLTMNKLGALLNHLLGDQRQNTPSLQILPDESVPEQTAEIRSALVKNIVFDSDSRVVFQTAFSQAVVGGFGAFRLATEYIDDYAFDQNIRIIEIRDPTRCYWDSSADNTCKTDGMYSGLRTRVSRKKFKSMYGKGLEKKIGATSFDDDGALSFVDDDSITIIDHYERTSDLITIYKMSNGKVFNKEQLSVLEKADIDEAEIYMIDGEPVSVQAERETCQYKIKHYKLAGDYILEEADFASEQLPIVYVDQNSYWDKKGNQITRSFFQDVKDAQRYLNYLATQSAYILKVSRYDQFIASRANVKAPDTQQIWADPSVQQGALIYDESPNGNKPEQLRPPELSQSLTQQYERCLVDIQSGTGMYNAQLGENGNEVSGKAIDARTKRGSYNTYVPFDSLNRAIACAGQIINEMIPKIYDVERSIMLAMPDRENKKVEINKDTDEYGAQTENDMTTGRYKIRLMPGASFEGQKTEALESMQMILQNDPTLFRLIGDLYVENLPVANHLELRNRIRTIIDPAIIEAGKTGQPLPPKPPQEDPMIALKKQDLENKMKMAEMNNQIKMQELQLKQAELQRKAIETQQDISVEWGRIEMEKEAAAAELQEVMLRYQAEAARGSIDMQINHANNLVKMLTHSPKHLENKPQQG
jgi:hypothetical protein